MPRSNLKVCVQTFEPRSASKHFNYRQGSIMHHSTCPSRVVLSKHLHAANCDYMRAYVRALVCAHTEAPSGNPLSSASSAARGSAAARGRGGGCRKWCGEGAGRLGGGRCGQGTASPGTVVAATNIYCHDNLTSPPPFTHNAGGPS